MDDNKAVKTKEEKRPAPHLLNIHRNTMKKIKYKVKAKAKFIAFLKVLFLVFILKMKIKEKT